ncbi:GNAT family N-acetyltransferase [Aquabacterium humicola]|uniref:GNAT family N-acetyltransferase n=1 Tax=Aquabacterium humicola TaxID=3237377 RepID=UPI0025439AA3|nr:GNAT family N-acetyltransferase [Rubrivivax pictus]
MHKTARLLLRRPDPDDVVRLFAIYGDPATNIYNPAGPFRDLQKAQTVLDVWLSHWQARGFGQWAIATREAPREIIGFGGIAWRRYVDADALNLGYRFDAAAWGRGYATELGQAALRQAFVDLREPEVFAIVRPANLPSIRVLEKLGMQRIGALDDVPGQPQSHLYRIAREAAVAR